MAARVTITDVKLIIDLDSTITDASIQVFIDQANLFVNANLGDSGLSEDILTEIERNIAAHFLHALDPRAKQEKAGEVAVTYAGNFGTGLSATTYGQTAIMMDTTGKLAAISSRKRAATIGVVDYSVEP
ncbi:MAG: DUF4054 domain-containing protein [Desulfobulbaceae bacterium]|nr:DUF4054 domain-containing protein [Desulfobulbaceae bacterium]